MILQAIPVSQSPETLIIGVIVAVGAIVSPFVTAFMTNRNAARMKLADFARQDEIAQRLSDRQDLSERKAAEVADQAAEAARLLVDSNHKQEEIAIVQDAKLDKIGATADKVHALTNSAMTASLEATATARRANAVSLSLIYRLEPTPKNEENAGTGERMAVEAEEAFRVHQATQAALNQNDKAAEEKVAKEKKV